MKKLYILFILFVGVAMTAQAQSDKTEKADKLFEQLRYVDAAEAYEKLLNNGVISTTVILKTLREIMLEP